MRDLDSLFTKNEIKYKEVDWVDVRINRNTKRIDTTLRVNLKDGGEKGLGSYTKPISLTYPATEYRTAYDWEKVPKEEITKYKKEPIKSRTRSFEELENLAIEGLNYHWGRNRNHAVAKDVKIESESYEVYMNAINTKDKAMDSVELIYNTNGNWMRSGNPGSVTLNPISWVGNLVSREAVCYNVGYIKYSNDWGYSYGVNEDINFKFTSAHEIGHEILKSYGGTVYSYGHKGSVNVVTQSRKSNAPDIDLKSNEEIDLMPYYESSNSLSYRHFERYSVSQKDTLGLIWLSKIYVS